MIKKELNTETKKRIGANIGHWRNLKGLKQKDIANRAGISEAALSKIENGGPSLNVSTMEKIANALEIEVEQLFSNPQQVFNLQNSHIDKQFFEKLMLMLENMTSYFMNNNKSA
jgi:transcriptional regulator with XRE-family HTH domain